MFCSMILTECSIDKLLNAKFTSFFITSLVFVKIVNAYISCEVCRKKFSKTCNIAIGVIAVFETNETKSFHHAINFINDLNVAEGRMNVNAVVFPLDQDESKLTDPTGWGLVGEIGNEILATNISALIGPETSSSVKKIHPFAVSKNVVHLAPSASDPSLGDERVFPHLIRMVPPDDYQIQAIIDTMQYHKHSTYSVIFSTDDYGNEAFGELWALTQRRKLKKQKLYRLENVGYSEELPSTIRDLAAKRPHAIILITHFKLGADVLLEAHKKNLTSANGWLWLALDGVTSEFKAADENALFDGIIGTRPCVVEKKLLRDFQKATAVDPLSYGMVKYLDSLLTIAYGYERLCGDSNSITTKDVNASTFRDYILKVNESGFSSHLSFDNSGKISTVEYDLLISLDSKWIPLGKWSSGKLQLNDSALAIQTASQDVQFHMNIATIIEKPFAYFENEDSGKDITHLHGYCIDLLKELSKNAGFTYTLHLVKDGQYGGYNKTSSTWNGLIGEVQRGEAELAVASVTGTKERAVVVDFLPTIMDVGLKFIYGKAAMSKKAEDYNPFAFLFPFHASLYLAIMLSVVLLSFFLSLISMLSPYGTRGSFFLSERADDLLTSKKSKLSRRAIRQLQEDKKEAERGMGLNNALYFVWAALFWQTPERVPRSVSGRIVTVAWYLAAVVFVASYTANMVGVISRHDKTSLTINSLPELMLQTDLIYGTVINSAVNAELERSPVKIARTLYALLENNPSMHYVPDAATGLAKVETGKYAFLWDSASLDYAAVESGCKLQTVDVGFGAVEYAFVISKNSSHFNVLSMHLLHLKERGFINRLYSQYFNMLSTCSLQESKSYQPRRLTFHDLAGIFYLVAMSMAVGMTILAGEWIMVAINDVNKNDPKAPQTIRESLYRRRNRLKDDIRKNWFPIESLAEKWSKLTLPTQDLAQRIIKKRLSNRSNKARSHKILPSKSESHVSVS